MDKLEDTETNLDDELRVAIRFITTNIPTEPSGRVARIANDFAQRTSGLMRTFSWDTDYIHLPGDFDSEDRSVTWIICDFNVHGRLPAASVPVQFWKVKYSDGSPYVDLQIPTMRVNPIHFNVSCETRVFTTRLTGPNGRQITDRYKWDGPENEWVFRLRERSRA